MDNPYYDWSPISTRPVLRWPDEAQIAFGVVISLEHLDWYPKAGTIVPPSIQGFRPDAYPRILDLHNISQQEYGNRVGVFRIMDVLERHGVRPTVAMDAAVAERSPFLVEYLLRRGAEFIGHGLSSEQLITEKMSEADERAIISGSLDAIEMASGQRPRGWVGAEYGESTRTVALLAEYGVDYVLDWPTDEQPHMMKVPTGRMVNMPVMIELDDILQHVGRVIPVDRFARMITEQFDRLYLDGATTGRLFLLNVHPWVMGHPFRIKYFEEAIAHIMAEPHVWAATGAEIVDAYVGQLSAMEARRG
jgi:peptidoglycan/xylan/chitin deacetylase (PgdA/CDA1 family)